MNAEFLSVKLSRREKTQPILAKKKKTLDNKKKCILRILTILGYLIERILEFIKQYRRFKT